ncbi:hypothetical protein [Frateuria aurantia]|uniref:Uncharacterized protein n=1 Tax=Frateuria aurantia (strain ATCC 33424 / DSM 6220 / KCTC 2777 / LMG 1558 / NBRC 3245 / NCIMB 13370) TaxID=767434 RepID=H8L655_FRAAD|nr:hypothetical protein [Frateuria aurantia]AFC85899.1 hypothetical protein Fraau_1477 [Frateuria aurantia DSM 6220]
MAHIGKLLGRLNPKTQTFTDASGGVPELTPQDIAGALAFVPSGLGRELLCHVWWPGGAERTRAQLDAAIMELLAKEWRRREDAQLDAMLMVATPDVGRRRAQDAFAQAHKERWPSWGKMEQGILQPSEVYVRIRDAVLMELRAGYFGDADSGAGRAWSDRDRAEMIERSNVTYSTNGWKRVYEWLLDHCANEVGIAQRRFGRAAA